MRTEELSLKNPMFNDAMVAADAALRVMVQRMYDRNLTEGSLKLNVHIEFEHREVIDPDSGEILPVIMPQIKFKTAYSINEGGTVDGRIENESNVLLYNRSGCKVAQINPQQQSMFD